MEYVPQKPEDVNVADFMLDTVLRASDADVARMMEDYLDSLAAHQTIDAIEALKARERDDGRGERRRRGRAGEDEDAGEAAVVDPAGDALLSRTERGEGARAVTPTAASVTRDRRPGARPRRLWRGRAVIWIAWRTSPRLVCG